MIHYRYVAEDLQQAEERIKTALRTKTDSEIDKAALQEIIFLEIRM